MQKNASISISLTVALLILLFLEGCSSSLQNVKLNPAYNFSDKQKITTYVVPTGDIERDESYRRVLFIDLRARGYNVVDANRLLKDNAETISGKNHRQLADSLMSKKYIPASDIYIIALPTWDSAYVLTYYSEKITRAQVFYSFKGMFVPTLKSQVAIYHGSLVLPIISYTATDTTYLYSENEDSKSAYQEFLWMVVAKQISRELVDIPICSIDNYSPAKYQFKINLWVDNSYRETFPTTWKDRLRLRVLYANDILRPQFNMELTISKFIEWNSRFQKSLDKTLKKLHEEKDSDPNTLQIGITLDKKLKKNWVSRTNIGFAFLLGDDAVITAQPSFPSIGQSWNPIEESLTLVHEVGHIFGAIHVPDQYSIMYPSSGSLSYEFDKVNKTLIESTKTDFFNPDVDVLLQNYSNSLITIRNNPSPNANPILSPMFSGIIQRYYEKHSSSEDPTKVYKYVSDVISDSVYSLSVIGYMEYKQKHYNEAKNNFLKVLELEPDFAEVHWYLSQVYDDLGERSLSNEHQKIAKPFIKLWIID